MFDLLDALPDEVIDHVDKQHFTALHHAVWQGNLDMVKLLLERGSNVESRTNSGHTAMDLAIRMGNVALTEAFRVEGVKASARGMKLLYHAISRGHVKMLRFLLDSDQFASLDCEDLSGNDPSELARRHGHAALGRWFSDNRMLKLTDTLDCAAATGDLERVEGLICRAAS